MVLRVLQKTRACTRAISKFLTRRCGYIDELAATPESTRPDCRPSTGTTQLLTAYLLAKHRLDQLREALLGFGGHCVAGFAAGGGPRAGVQSLWRVNRHGWKNLGARPLRHQADSTTI